MNVEVRKKTKNDFEKDFFKLMNNAVFGKTVEYVRKYRDTKLVTTERRRNYLASEPNYHTTKFFTEYLLAVEMKNKTQILMNKLVYLGLLILELSKIFMYEFCYDYVRAKYGEKTKLCFMDTDIFIKTDDVETAIIHKIFEKNSNFYVKERNTGKFSFLFSAVFS